MLLNSNLIRDDVQSIEKIIKILLDIEIVEHSELEGSLADNEAFIDLAKQALHYDEE